MAGLDPAIHVLLSAQKNMDARVKPAHDDVLTFFPVPGAMQREAVHRRTGTVTSAM
jgi:hypothetical protein